MCTINIYAVMKDVSSYLTEEAFVAWEAQVCDILGCFFTFMFLSFVRDINTELPLSKPEEFLR